MKSRSKERAVVVCTAKRGVFFGYTTETGAEIVARGTVTLARSRMCVHWSRETHGVMGLAGIGPQEGSRVGPSVPEFTCESITGVMVCSGEAVKAWEAETWS